MNSLRADFLVGAACLLLASSFSGCTKESTAQAPPPPPTVGVMQPIERVVTDYSEFTGRLQAPYTVDIRARVTGYIVKMPFVEGTEVHEGDLLFEIDPRPYQAQLDRAQGEVLLNEAKLKLAKADNVRAKAIAQANVGAISKQDLDKYAAAEDEAEAAVEASKANLETYRLNVEFTKVISPIAGQVSKYNLTIGNLVNADMTVLTTVVSQDPMYAYFDVDEQTLLKILRRMMNEQTASIQSKTFPVQMSLGDEEGFPHDGALNFANNVVSSSTGTMTVRGEFENPVSVAGRRLLRPGMFVRIRLPVGEPHSAVLVSEKALGNDQGRRYVWVVDSARQVKYQRVTVGPLQDDGMRVIESGLSTSDTVIVSGLQLVRAGIEVKTEQEKPHRDAASGEEVPAKESAAKEPPQDKPTGEQPAAPTSEQK